MAAKWTRSNVVGMPTGDIVKCLNELEQRIAELTAERDQARAEHQAWLQRYEEYRTTVNDTLAAMMAERDQARAERDALQFAEIDRVNSLGLIDQLKNERDELRHEIAALRAALAGTWQPVADIDMAFREADGWWAIWGDSPQGMYQIRSGQTIDDDTWKEIIALLPAHLRLCERRAPAQEE